MVNFMWIIWCELSASYAWWTLHEENIKRSFTFISQKHLFEENRAFHFSTALWYKNIREWSLFMGRGWPVHSRKSFPLKRAIMDFNGNLLTCCWNIILLYSTDEMHNNEQMIRGCLLNLYFFFSIYQEKWYLSMDISVSRNKTRCSDFSSN